MQFIRFPTAWSWLPRRSRYFRTRPNRFCWTRISCTASTGGLNRACGTSRDDVRRVHAVDEPLLLIGPPAGDRHARTDDVARDEHRIAFQRQQLAYAAAGQRHVHHCLVFNELAEVDVSDSSRGVDAVTSMASDTCPNSMRISSRLTRADSNTIPLRAYPRKPFAWAVSRYRPGGSSGIIFAGLVAGRSFYDSRIFIGKFDRDAGQIRLRRIGNDPRERPCRALSKQRRAPAKQDEQHNRSHPRFPAFSSRAMSYRALM